MTDQNEEYNPFQAPEVPFSDGHLAEGNAEAIRREYLSHEASVKSIGLLYFLGAFFFLIATLFVLQAQTGSGSVESTFLSLCLPILGLLQLFTAYGLRKLKSWARIPTGLISGIGLLSFPIGTLINAYILYLIFSAKGKMVFSDDYRSIIDQTPHIKYKTSAVVWVLLFILLAIFSVAIVMG